MRLTCITSGFISEFSHLAEEPQFYFSLCFPNWKEYRTFKVRSAIMHLLGTLGISFEITNLFINGHMSIAVYRHDYMPINIQP